LSASYLLKAVATAEMSMALRAQGSGLMGGAVLVGQVFLLAEMLTG
jgi:hypothetical protein